ncbi:aldehyde dehydrogenase family protein [Streptomyces sp. DSM 3412]|uniref:Aldehyde dehydrogenase family protein n=1 Tax=Streptomyces gottesmaniae TaxID=3075518 RepID=A0ABU2Z3M4_9ACTN|nr:aldehyde dehydrogenase family protein [Streptomyces sp. DSM 3412]MDT0570269.1 aldehyde dehydrogenase family protein [Streptomyces sp. DSM 3412]
MRTQGLYIGGAWQHPDTTFTVTDPWDGTVVGRVASAEAHQAAAAVDAAVAADCPAAHERARMLRRTADLVEERAELFAQTIRAEAGKPISAARGEVGRAVDTLRLSAEEARRLAGEAIPMDAVAAGEGLLAFTVPRPVGPVAAITPFNFPLNLVAHKVGPAVAAGCPVLLKPSERTPLTAGLLVECFDEAGLPAGMLNLVTGDPGTVVGTWTDDPRVSVLTFTGSASVGWSLKQRSPAKRHVLELGSNTAMVVADDADLDAAVQAAVTAAFTYSGQACISLQRVYVTPGAAEPFLERLAKAAESLVSGDPKDESTVVGPLISAEATQRVRSWVEAALSSGASLRAGGDVTDGVLRPTVLADVPSDASVMCEEVFGPVVSVNTVPDLDAAVREVNASRFGLNTAVFTASTATALKYVRQAEAGAVLVNLAPSFRTDHMPYGGVKDSGEGREGVPYAVRALLDPKLVILGG